MRTTSKNRIDPSLIPEDQLARVAKAFAKPGHLLITDCNGGQSEIPEVLFRHFARIVQLMADKKAIVLIPENEDFTTQAAADYLGMSRQHLVDLLESGRISHHKVGTHRRVTFKDLLAYEQERDASRRGSLDDLEAEVDAAGLYDSSFAGGQ